MTPPSGEQHEIAAHGYRAVVTQSGATLRHLSYGGDGDNGGDDNVGGPGDAHDLIVGFAETEMCSGGRGQVLVPWSNRIRDGAYTVAGRDRQLPLSEAGRHNASHGLVRWASWALEHSEPREMRFGYRLMAQPGYPWTLDLAVAYALDPDGLTVTISALNRSDSPAPFGCGAHPYLTAGSERVDDDELRLPGSTRLLTDDERKLPTGREPVAGTAYDFRAGGAIGDTVVDHAFTDLARDLDGRATVRLTSPSGRAVELWADERFGWLQAYTADDQPTMARRAVAIEPTTAPPDAFNSGDDLVVLDPGAAFEATWGIRQVR